MRKKKKRKINEVEVISLWFIVGFVLLGIFIGIGHYIIVDLRDAFQKGPLNPLTDEVNLYTTPELQTPIEVTPELEVNWYEQEITSWLSPVESEELRSQPDVVNFMELRPGGSLIAANQTIQWNDSWQQGRPFFIEALNVQQTAVQIRINGSVYHINVYQPFVWATFPHEVVMVDENGIIWTLSREQVEFISTGTVNLPITVFANSNLEFSSR